MTGNSQSWLCLHPSCFEDRIRLLAPVHWAPKLCQGLQSLVPWIQLAIAHPSQHAGYWALAWSDVAGRASTAEMSSHWQAERWLCQIERSVRQLSKECWIDLGEVGVKTNLDSLQYLMIRFDESSIHACQRSRITFPFASVINCVWMSLAWDTDVQVLPYTPSLQKFYRVARDGGRNTVLL